MDFGVIKLYRKDSKGAIRIWTIESDDGEILMEHGLLDGALQEVFEYIDEGLAGRSVDQQVELVINSKIKTRIDKGYVYSLEDAISNPVTNALGYKRAMTAQKYRDLKEPLDWDAVIPQFKYNGHRCLVINDGGRIVAYSRNGIEIEGIHEIVRDLKNSLPVGKTLDGELYCHGVKLQTISSWAKKRQEDTKKLQYIVYDYMSDDCYSLRSRQLNRIVRNANSNFIRPAETIDLTGGIKARLDRAIDYEKYEGIILRRLGFPYEDGKRSKSLIKVKRFYDAEFIIMDIISSKDGWARFRLLTDAGKQFYVSCHGPVSFKEKVLKEASKYRGATVNVEYPELTNDGIPSQPICTGFVNRQFD